MKLSKLSVALLAAAPVLASAAAIDRSGQSIDAFFQKGNYAELSYVFVDPNIEGETLVTVPGSKAGTKIKDAFPGYGYTGAALKFEPAKGVSAAVIYDEPWGVDTDYKQSGLIYNGAFADVGSSTITTLAGFNPIPNIKAYGGLVFESIDTELVYPGERYKLEYEDDSIGYIGGLAFEKPELAMRAAVTYRSAIDHKVGTEETLVAGGRTLGPIAGRMEISLPQSVNFDFQTGVNKTTLALAGVRWVNWKEFKISPEVFTGTSKTLPLPTPLGNSITNYSDDQISAYLGVGKRLTDRLSGVVKVAYDTGTGPDNTSLFGPYKDKIGVSVGGKYNFNKNVAGSLGVGYTVLGDEDVDRKISGGPAYSKHTDGYGVAVGGKIGVNF